MSDLSSHLLNFPKEPSLKHPTPIKQILLQELTPPSDPSPSSTDTSTVELTGGAEGATIRSGILLLVNTSIGSSVIATPYAFACLGSVYGFFWISFAALLAGFSIHTIFQVARYLTPSEQRISSDKSQSSFINAAKHLYPPLLPVVYASIIAGNWGVCISYLVLIGNSLPILLRSLFPDFVVAREAAIFGSLALVIFPLSLVRSLTSLRFASGLALLCIMYIVLLIFGYFLLFLWFADYSFPVGLGISGGSMTDNVLSFYYDRNIDYWRASSLMDLFRALPIFVFGFTCHLNVFKLYNEIAPKYKNAESLRKLNVLSISLMYFIYLMIGLLGYFTLGNGVSGNILDSYDQPGTFFGKVLDRVDPFRVSILLGRFSIIILVMTCFPVQLHATRDTIISVLFILREKWKKRSFTRRSSSRERFTRIAQDRESTDDLNLPDTLQENIPDTTLLLGDPEEGTGFRHDSIVDIPGVFDPPSVASPIVSFKVFFVVTLVFSLLCYAVAIFVYDFSRVLAFVGATGANWVALFFGPFFYFRIIPFWSSIEKWICLFVMSFSVILMIGVLSFQFSDLLYY